MSNVSASLHPSSPMSGNGRDSFHAQLASIVEVLANTAVAEICKLVDDGFAVLRLEVSQNQRVINGLRRKLLLAKIQTSRRSHLEKLGALSRTGHVSRSAVKSRNNPENGKTQGTEGRDRESELPVIVKVESVKSNGLEDVQAPVNPGCETTSTASTNSSSSSPESRSLRAHPESQKNLDKLNRNADQIFQSRTPSFLSQPSSENATWESYCPIANSEGAFTCTRNNRNNDNSFTSSSQWAEASTDKETWTNPIPGNCSRHPTHNPSPGRRGATGTKSDGSGGSKGGAGAVSGDLGNVGLTLAGNLDWKPDVMVSSVPIKVEGDMSSGWSMMDGDMRSGGMSAKLRQQRESQAGAGQGRKEAMGVRGGGESDGKERGMGGEVAVKYPPLLLRNPAMAERSTWFKSALEDIKTLPSCGGLSSSSSCSSSFSTTIKSSRQVLHPQSNQMDKPDTLNNLDACSSRGGLGRPLGYPPPTPLLSQRLVSGRGHQYHCELCGKTFGKFPSLRRHQRVHTGEKPFSCHHCGKRFSHRHQVKNHERVHTGEKPFCCPICGRCFVQSNHMKRHLNTHTSGDRATS